MEALVLAWVLIGVTLAAFVKAIEALGLLD